MQHKIKSAAEIEQILEKCREQGQRIVQCHGVFDLLHPGHIRHLKQAKTQGDMLVVSITPDRFVNKGPGRPAFNEQLRAETLAALQDVDLVVLNDAPDAITAIRRIKPSVYVKGMEYKDHGADVTGKISEEAKAVEEVGGAIFYTDDIVFSSSSLLNRYFDPPTPEVHQFLELFKSRYTLDEVLQKVENLSKLKVLVIGDAIIDEYQYTQPLGQSGKGVHMVARCLEKEVFLGGSLIVANHVAQFAGQVTVLSAIGNSCPYRSFIKTTLDSKVHPEFLYLDNFSTLTKRRYVLKDGKSVTKLFETYSTNDQLLNGPQSDYVVQYIEAQAKDYDLIIVTDFGNGFTNPHIVETLSKAPVFLAINTQTNSGNRGFNVITHYHRADFISVNEPELRLAAHDRYNSIEHLASVIGEVMKCPSIAVTRGVNGVYCHAEDGNYHIPAFTQTSVDRIGAGDSFLSIASLCRAMDYPLLLSATIGSVAAAMSVQMVGNQEAIKKAPLCKFLTRLLK